MSLITAGADINHQDQVETHIYIILYINLLLFLLHNVYTCHGLGPVKAGFYH